MTLQSQLIAISNRGFLKRISDDLFQGIKKVYNTDPSERRRWIWELIQNAKDTPTPENFEGVSIRVMINENSLEFSHNGNPFTIENLVGIIQQVSTKSSDVADEETTGKFGTGFITTHMLSRIINVSGIVTYDNQYKRFEFELNRDADTQEALLNKVEEQIQQLYKLPDDSLFEPKSISELHRTESSFDTCFKYPLSESSIKYALQGIEDLKRTAHYALLFNSKIKQFEIIDKIKNEQYKISRESQNNISENITEVTTKTENNNSVSLEHLLCYKKNSDFEIAIPVSKMQSGYEILIPDDSTPRIFKDFPLVGTEEWGANFIFNSKKIQPTEPRNGLELHVEEDAPKIEQELNRTVLKEIYQSFAEIINQLAGSVTQIENLYYLCESALLKNKAIIHDDVKQWLKEEIQIPFRSNLVNLPLVQTFDGLKKISECRFPDFSKIDGKNKVFYSICKEIFGNIIPDDNHYEKWLTIISGDTKTWGEGLLFGIDDLVDYIQKKRELQNFPEFEATVEAIQWLNSLYDFILSNKRNDLFTNKIIPNQSGILCYPSELSRDLDIPDEIKEIAITFGFSYRSKLSDKRVICSEIAKEISVEDVSKELNSKIGVLTQKINPKTGQHEITEDIFSSLISLCCIFSVSNTNDKRRKVLNHLNGFYSEINLSNDLIPESKNFDFTSALKCLTKYALLQISLLGSTEKLKERLNQEDDEQTISWLNNLLFEINDNSDLNEFLNHFGVFPNQNKTFALKSTLSQDLDNIEPQLKDIYSKLYPQDEIRNRLLIDGIGVYPESKVTFEEVARKIDNALKEKHNDTTNPEIKTIILQMVSWCKANQTKATQYFTWLESNKALLVLQTIEGDNAQQDIFRILQSNQDYKKLADIAESGADLNKITQLAELSKNLNIETALSILQNHPELTNEKIERLLELEELSKGWNPNLEYDPNDEQIRINFENGWKGEAFVFKEMIKKGFDVVWENKSSRETGNVITDFENETHFIDDKGNKYDLIINVSSESKMFVQVKTTTTDIGKADQIALPISTKEWKFVHETNQNDSYYLARVFNINEVPELYLMKLETPQILK
ncbi:MAG: DUF3883 domain-containing protein [Weeksellaceae bacterium]|nr:DUF3883 domain-containing protein [Weeksellaceae bacterium]